MTEPVRVVGAEAERVKREALGIADRRKHQGRAAIPMQRGPARKSLRPRLLTDRTPPR